MTLIGKKCSVLFSLCVFVSLFSKRLKLRLWEPLNGLEESVLSTVRAPSACGFFLCGHDVIVFLPPVRYVVLLFLDKQRIVLMSPCGSRARFQNLLTLAKLSFFLPSKVSLGWTISISIKDSLSFIEVCHLLERRIVHALFC